ncbi:MAG TPA: hypothetical protein VKY92_11685 [Verrucomicrobiae bacterium]|nr:hypothetical protein [Verrucomicrobiae bacterium]
MKRLLAVFFFSGFLTGASAQGLVNFLNTSSTLSSAPIAGRNVATGGPVNSWFYGLLIGGSIAPTTFFFSGVYATNIVGASGRFFGGTSVQVPG